MRKWACQTIIVLSVMLLLPAVMHAETTGLEEQQEDLATEIAVLEDEFIELLEELIDVETEMKALERHIDENERALHTIEQEIASEEKQQEELDEEIRRLELDIKERLTLLGDRAASFQRSGGNTASFLEVIFGAEDFGDLISRVVTLSQIVQADHHVVDQLEASQRSLAQAEEDVTVSIANLEEARQSKAMQADELEGRKQELASLTRYIGRQEAQLQTMITRLEQEKSDLADQEAMLRAQMAEEREQKRIEEQRRAQERAEEARVEEERRAEEQARHDSQTATGGSNASGGSTEASPPAESSGSSSEWQTFRATAYTAYCAGCSGVTFTGVDLRANPNAKVIAVDPSVIPLGSRVEVRGFGTYTAADIGGAIQGEKIDIFMPNRDDVLRFGRQTVEIRVLE